MQDTIFAKITLICLLVASFGVSCTRARTASSMKVRELSKEIGINWEANICFEAESRIEKAAATTDGGFVAVGYTFEDPVDNGPDWFASAHDGMGNLLWKRQYKEAEMLGWPSDVYHEDGISIIVGNRFKSPTNPSIRAVQIDRNGKPLWDRNYLGGSEAIDPTAGSAMATGVLAHPDGGYVICGTSGRLVPGRLVGYLMRITEGGDMLWEKAVGADLSTHVELSFISQAHGEDIYVGGRMYVEGPISGGDAYLAKTTADGALVWETTVEGKHGMEWLSFSDACIMSDKIIVIGTCTPLVGRELGYICSVNMDGEVLRKRKIGYDDAVIELRGCIGSPGGSVLVGSSTDDNFDSKLLVMEVDDELEINSYGTFRKEGRSYSAEGVFQLGEQLILVGWSGGRDSGLVGIAASVLLW